jgi:hypothetical protein
MKNNKPHLKKLDDCSRPMIFISYEKGSKAYQAYDPVSKHVHISRDMMFDEQVEQAQWDWEQGNGDDQQNHNNEFKVEYTTVSQMPPVAEHTVEATEMEQGRSPTPGVLVQDEEEEKQGDVRVVELDADHDDAPLQLRSINDILGQVFHFVSTEEPGSLAKLWPIPAGTMQCWRRWL